MKISLENTRPFAGFGTKTPKKVAPVTPAEPMSPTAFPLSPAGQLDVTAATLSPFGAQSPMAFTRTNTLQSPLTAAAERLARASEHSESVRQDRLLQQAADQVRGFLCFGNESNSFFSFCLFCLMQSAALRRQLDELDKTVGSPTGTHKQKPLMSSLRTSHRSIAMSSATETGQTMLANKQTSKAFDAVLLPGPVWRRIFDFLPLMHEAKVVPRLSKSFNKIYRLALRGMREDASVCFAKH
jgi:hypothetical protein